MKKLIKFLSVALIGAVLIGCGGGGGSNTPASGSLDKSFGDNGKVITGGAQDDVILDIISNNDETIYVSGAIQTVANGWDCMLSKYSKNGLVIDNFATNGVASSIIIGYDVCNAMAKDSNGNIYLAGRYISDNNGAGGLIGKYKPNGFLDTAFDGHGYKWFSLAYKLNAIAMQNGKIVVAGQYKDRNKGFIARLNSNGSIDESFGANGYIAFGNRTTHYDIKDIAIDNNGKIILVGNQNDENIFIAKLRTDGHFDTTFGTNGIVTYDNNDYIDIANAVAIDSNRKIIVAGASNGVMALIKLNNDGSFDLSFGTKGIVLDESGELLSEGLDLTIDANDNILVVGANNASTRKMIIWRFDTTGKADITFNNSGITTFKNKYVDGGYILGSAITLDDNGKILVGGSIDTGNSKHIEMAIWRINP